MTGAVAATVVVTGVVFADIAALACAVAVNPGSGAAVFVAAEPAVVVGVVPESVLAGSEGPGGAASGCELAAMAAAAMASGAVGPPDAGAVAGTFVVGVVTGITTATGVGVALPACSARMVASTAAKAASAFVCESLDLESDGCVVSDVVVVFV